MLHQEPKLAAGFKESVSLGTKAEEGPARPRSLNFAVLLSPRTPQSLELKHRMGNIKGLPRKRRAVGESESVNRQASAGHVAGAAPAEAAGGPAGAKHDIHHALQIATYPKPRVLVTSDRILRPTSKLQYREFIDSRDGQFLGQSRRRAQPYIRVRVVTGVLCLPVTYVHL